MKNSVRQIRLCFYHMLGIISKISYLLNYYYYNYANNLGQVCTWPFNCLKVIHIL